MFFSLFLTCVVSLAICTLLLITIGHRVKLRFGLAAVILLLGVTIGSGEIAARIWNLSSRYVAFAQIGELAIGLTCILALRAWNIVGKVFYGSLISAAGAYLAFAAWYTVRGGLSGLGVAASAFLLLLEGGALLLSSWYAFDACDSLCRPVARRPEPKLDPSYTPMVSLQIAAYNEPPDMLIETIKSAENMDYPNHEVVVIDNNTKDPAVWQPVADYCRERPKVRFEHVDDWPGFKAGALNLAMSKFTSPEAEIVGVIDADYIIDPSYLKSLVGYFADQKIAFVQTPQDYRDWEGDPYLTACADAYEYFFKATMPSRNDRNSIIFAGTMGLLRRSVIQKLGGWEEWCITEDAEASLRMLKAGYDGLYVPKSFGKGIMPLTFAALKSQRFRWALGGIQILKKHWRELMPGRRTAENHLTMAQRLDYLFGNLHWFNDLLYLAFSVVLLSSALLLFTNSHVAIRPLIGAVTLLPAALIGSGLLRALWALRVKEGIGVGRAMRAFANWLSLSWTGALACMNGLVRSEAVFLRTPKSEDAPTFFDALRASKTETFYTAVLWGAGVLLAVKGKATALLLGLLAWQGIVYFTSPYMAVLNERAELPAELERRRRTEHLRERIAKRWPVFVGAAAGFAAAGLAIALLFAGGNSPGRPANPFVVPHAAAGDQGPLSTLIQGGNVFQAPVVSPSATVSETPTPTFSETVSPSPSLSPSESLSPTVTTSPSPSPSSTL
jgi:cellulose synthase/poly-beta-1,6-N-acetylglucosamine synthase-like glycosyltransferase